MPDGSAKEAPLATDDAGQSRVEAAPLPVATAVSDRDFIRVVQRIRAFKVFLNSGAVPNLQPINPDLDHTKIYPFYAFHYDGTARRPTPEEWRQLETLHEELFSNYKQDVVLRFTKGQPIFWIKRLPLWLLAGAAIAFVLATAGSIIGTPISQVGTVLTLIGYLGWTLSLGALGATAYIAVNALGLQTENPFDVTDLNSVLIRIVIGGVFGFIIALAISLPAFSGFAKTAWTLASNGTAVSVPAPTKPAAPDPSNGATAPTPAAPSSLPKEEAASQPPEDIYLAGKVLLPFLLGFSTSLVLTILNRLIVVVETLFGVSRRAV